MREMLLFSFFALGCGAAPGLAPPAQPDSMAAPPESTSATLAPREGDPCEGATGLVLVPPASLPGHWRGSSVTGGEGDLSMRWCGEGTVAIESVTLASGDTATSRWEADPALPRLRHGEAQTQRLLGPAAPQHLSITVVARGDDGAEIVVSASTEAVLDPVFVAAQAACTARGGVFHPVGLAQNYACDAPTHDAGRRCLSSETCEGSCLYDHAEVNAAPPDGRTCAPGEEVRLHVGNCSPRSILFGCHARLTEVTTECVRRGALVGRRVVCTD